MPAVLGSVSAFLKDTFNEDIKKLVQPLGITTAAIFIFLNLFLILPPLEERNNPVVRGFLSLEDGWQVVTVVLITLVLSYLLLNFSTWILRLLTGELWAESIWFGHRLKENQRKSKINLALDYETGRARTKAQEISLGESEDYVKRQRLRARREWPGLITGDPEDDGRALAIRRASLRESEKKYDEESTQKAEFSLKLWAKITSFPEEDGFLAPTALGNVMNATASYIWRHYRIDFTALWPHMETVMSDSTDHKALKSRIDNEKSALDFLVGLTFTILLFGAEYLLFNAFLLKELSGLVVLGGLLVLAFITYRVAVGKARSWGDAVQMSFDLCRDELRKKLGIREFRSWADEQDVWTRVSGWMLWGGVGIDEDVPEDAFKVQGESLPLSATVTVPNKIQHKLEYGVTSMVPATAAIREPASGTGNYVLQYRRSVEYALMLQTDSDKPIDNVQVIISDPQVPYIGAAPTATSWGNVAPPLQPVPRPAADVMRTLAEFTPGSGGVPANKVLWKIRQVLPNQVYVLRYRLPVPVLMATTNSDCLRISLEEIKHPDNSDFRYTCSFRIENTGDEEVNAVLDVFDMRVDRELQWTEGLLRGPDGSRDPIKATVNEKLNRHRWTLGRIAPTNGWVTLAYSIKRW
ncbi:MAG TPA: hypothetical protein VF952_02660 [Chloroflexia bacterium]|jgi:hypothetical protein